MKKLLTTTPFLFLGLLSWGQQSVFSQADIKSTRVFYNGAEITQTATVQLPKGQSEIVLTNIAEQIDQNTLQFGAKEDISILSSQFSNAYLEEYDQNASSKLTKALKDSIEDTERKLNQITNEIETDKQTVKLLDNNAEEGEKSIQLSTVDEMKKWIALYKSQRKELQNGIFEKAKKQKKLQEKLDRLKAELDTGADGKYKISRGKLILQVMSKQQQSVSLQLNYITYAARWTPSYDLQIEKLNAPINLQYKAQVYQNSGINWENTKLSLTSGQVGQYNQLPSWNNWFIDYQQPRQNTARLETTMDMAAAPQSTAVFAKKNSVAEYTSVQENQLNMTFDISLPYTILSNNKAHSIDLNQYTLQGKYQYYSAPKLDATAYLMAEIEDYDAQNLLSGNANVIFENMHVGKTQLSTENTDKKLKLNLGRDAQIVVERKLVSDKSGTQFLSSRKEQRFVYDIKVKNNKSQNVTLKLEDQFPLSKDESIEVSLTDKSGADIDEERGLATWNLTLKPGELKTIRFGYQIKYKKDKELSGI